MEITDAKNLLPLPALLNRLGVPTPERNRFNIKCPLHSEQNGESFSVERKNGTWLWNCFGKCDHGGDEITFLEAYKSLSNVEAIKLYLDMAGGSGNGTAEVKTKATTPVPTQAEKRKTIEFDWDKAVSPLKSEARVAKERGYSIELVAELQANGLIGSFNGHIAFPVHREGEVVGVHYKVKDHWRYFPKGTKIAPLVIGELALGPVHIFESQWDALAFMDRSGERSGIIITRGAKNGALVAGLISHGSTVYAWTQNDAPAEEWQRTVCANTCAVVKQPKIPAPHKDLNDWTRAGVSSVDLLAAIENAEIVQKATVEERPLPDCCFDTGRNVYWIKNHRGSWIALNETQFKRELRQRGISPIVPRSSYVSPLDERLLDIQHNCDIHYAGALAGCAAGIYEIGERRILVTESPRLIEPERGDWPTLHTFVTGLLRDLVFDQVRYLYGWLKVAYEAIRAHQRRPGQGLVLAGVRDCGKSLLQNIITLILGGRSARPYQFMSGLTPFNSDLFEAEHLLIEDEQASTDIRTRRNFGAQLKNITVIDWQRCHAKNRVAISLTPFWRLSISVNDEPENLMVLPPIDDSIEDKLIILRASKSPMPMPTATINQRKAFWETLEHELPAFLHFLVDWQIPDELSSERFGIAHFHHPEILQTIDNLAPEFRLLNLIDDQLFRDGDDMWDGTAEQLERLLTSEDSSCRFEARRLFTFNTACGVYLGRLAKKHPERFSYDRTNAARLWTINRVTG